MRLTALTDSPAAFLAAYEDECRYSEEEWRAEFGRGEWIIGEIGGHPVSLVGVTREPGAPDSERYLEYMWVEPGYRRSHVAIKMLAAIFSDLKESGVRTVFLWVLDGNRAAVQLYQQLDFVSTAERQRLTIRPESFEERFRLDLT
ncbi:MAG TPA: GNAT family N-acetyltransferase [Streptosporangiaceae bacterium]|jgi:ribosomal protein S18 acetylase RimI-like enzyme|nr:GNAT family N-acetyltransferase [Streptosporangiaceae bacterium]